MQRTAKQSIKEQSPPTLGPNSHATPTHETCLAAPRVLENTMGSSKIHSTSCPRIASGSKIARTSTRHKAPILHPATEQLETTKLQSESKWWTLTSERALMVSRSRALEPPLLLRRSEAQEPTNPPTNEQPQWRLAHLLGASSHFPSLALQAAHPLFQPLSTHLYR
mmetsp:Transcript_22244/g.51318  ORF Transcript_22244/g.51318 Transcript_22244/m.51318 type:complete len:166 (+) Transcript_22244:206-703(+)